MRTAAFQTRHARSSGPHYENTHSLNFRIRLLSPGMSLRPQRSVNWNSPTVHLHCLAKLSARRPWEVAVSQGWTITLTKKVGDQIHAYLSSNTSQMSKCHDPRPMSEFFHSSAQGSVTRQKRRVALRRSRLVRRFQLKVFSGAPVRHSVTRTCQAGRLPTGCQPQTFNPQKIWIYYAIDNYWPTREPERNDKATQKCSSSYHKK